MSEEDARPFLSRDVDAPLTTAEITGLVYALASLVCGIAVLRWMYVTSRNAHAFSSRMTMSPGWTVGWFFVPVVSLWKPFQGVREAWTATVDPERPDAVALPGWIRIWWGLWIATTLLGNLSFRLSLKADTAPEMMVVDAIFFGTLAIDVPLFILLRRLIAELSAMQAARLEERSDLT